MERSSANKTLLACEHEDTTTAILVVDDSRLQRKIVVSFLKRWGYRILEASSAEQGLEMCKHQTIDIVISDWMMPGMSGLEFCSHYRKLSGSRYGYFILVTSRSEKSDIAEGLNNGADDFLTKPVASNELLARIRAGERILDMERTLKARNQLIQKSLDELNSLYLALERDLAAARKLQQALVPERAGRFRRTSFNALLRPSGHVGGDLVGFNKITDRHVAFFSLDVSGHGVASAMITARLAAFLTGSKSKETTTQTGASDGLKPRKPSEVARSLNAYVLDGIETDHFFTIIYGYIDVESGHVKFCQCGHPNALLKRADGRFEQIGEGGFPVGLFPNAEWPDQSVRLFSGDRLFLFSDGATELHNSDGLMLAEEGLQALLTGYPETDAQELFEVLIWDLAEWADDEDFPDDISALLVEMH